MDIVVDSGNSVTKVGVFHESENIQVREFTDIIQAIEVVNELSPHNAILSTVSSTSIDYEGLIQINGLFVVLSHETPIPIKNDYGTPETLGMDRLAAAVGAWDLYPGKNILIIDAGTCITYDIINNDGVFLGGSISPGVNIRFRSLHDYTANLPEVKQNWDYNTPGSTTEEAIKSGVLNGAIAECDGFIRQYEKKYGDLIVILTGGYYKLFESKTKHNIFAVPNLVMKGLHRILRYNV